MNETRRILKTAVTSVFLFVCEVARPVCRFQEVSVLCYHSVGEDGWELSTPPSKFRRELDFFKRRGYYFATLDEIAAYARKKRPLPLQTLAVTFDDGYGSVFTQAFPILKEMNIPAAVFLVADFEGSREARRCALPGLSEEQVSEMENSRLITFGYHSKTHPSLTELHGAALDAELAPPKPYRYFAYPGGHHSKEAHEALARNGYCAAFTISPGLVRRGSNPYAIRRSVVTADMPLWQVYMRTTKAIDWYRALVRRIR
jgi:peptidoglycan/xylan/chitin deacetylase (PgdA/CDA1 family)